MTKPDLTRAVWFKSTRSDNNGGACVEAAHLEDGGMAVRDSKDKFGPVLVFNPAEWSAFILGTKDGEFDL